VALVLVPRLEADLGRILVGVPAFELGPGRQASRQVIRLLAGRVDGLDLLQAQLDPDPLPGPEGSDTAFLVGSYCGDDDAPVEPVDLLLARGFEGAHVLGEKRDLSDELRLEAG
jgi:hypothetical protein